MNRRSKQTTESTVSPLVVVASQVEKVQIEVEATVILYQIPRLLPAAGQLMLSFPASVALQTLTALCNPGAVI